MAIPLAGKLRSLTPGARDILKRAVVPTPRFIVYTDALVSVPQPTDIWGYNVLMLSFLSPSGPTDMAQTWQNLSPEQRARYQKEYDNARITLMVSAFGSAETPTSSGVDPINAANNLATWVKEYNVQGIDIDYEDFAAFDAGSAEQWLITLTRQLRSQLPQGDYLLTHAPVAPWFAPNLWKGGGYLKVEGQVGKMIDWYNTQFYNQGANEYTDCRGLLTSSSPSNPESALFQIGSNSVDVNKLVIGKPAEASKANNGFMDTDTLASCIVQANGWGWNGGIMAWEYSHATSGWLASVRGNTF